MEYKYVDELVPAPPYEFKRHIGVAVAKHATPPDSSSVRSVKTTGILLNSSTCWCIGVIGHAIAKHTWRSSVQSGSSPHRPSASDETWRNTRTLIGYKIQMCITQVCQQLLVQQEDQALSSDKSSPKKLLYLLEITRITSRYMDRSTCTFVQTKIRNCKG